MAPSPASPPDGSGDEATPPGESRIADCGADGCTPNGSRRTQGCLNDPRLPVEPDMARQRRVVVVGGSTGRLMPNAPPGEWTRAFRRCCRLKRVADPHADIGQAAVA